MTVQILNLCTHHPARSELAEGLLKHWASKLGRDVQAHSAGGAQRGRINPFALQASKHAGIDINACRSKSWSEFSADAAPPCPS